MYDEEPIEGQFTEEPEERGLTVVVPPRQAIDTSQTPEDTVELATRMASSLADIVERQELYATINGKKFPEVEAWMTVARLDGVVAREVKVETQGACPVPECPVLTDGYEAWVELLRLRDGAVIGGGSSIAGFHGDKAGSNDWHTRNRLQQRSMAITRATSRAFRQQYAWIMALAGYQPTPAEEMGDTEPTGTRQNARQPSKSGPGAAQTPKAAPSGGNAGTAAPTASDGETLQAVVDAQPEGAIRMVRSKRWEGERAKVEVVTKVGNKKHTAYVIGPLAEATVAASLQIGEAVQFVGAHVEEVVWQEGKPTKKEVWGTGDGFLMTDVLVMREEAWTSVRQYAPALWPSEPTPSSDSPSPEATSAPAATTSSPTTPTEPPSSPTPAAATPTSPTAPGSERRVGTTGEWELVQGQLLDPIQFTMKGSQAIAVLRVADKATGEIIMAALGNDIAEQLGTAEAPLVAAGELVSLYGEWQGKWLIVDTAGKVPS